LTMSKSLKGRDFTILVSERFPRTDEQCVYEIAFRRWLVREIEEGRLTVAQAIERFNINPGSGFKLIRDWRRKYAPSMVLPLADMTEQEKQQLTALQKQVKTLGQQLEEARMRNIALDTLIDVAEEKLKISIRKKPGAKQ
jgi:transposase-like protein